ncbi:MAG: hypothetical protein M1834_008769 [Cirrosporium novae-zelandiae]|nr:MAG: hypothetical protein M1834_008769 [Cirrosporium novae-zelandiae]
MVLAIKEKADDAFLHGSTHLAFTRYLSCLRLIKRKPKIPYHHQLFFSCHANATLPFLKLFLEKDFNVNPHNQLSMMSFYFLEHESYYDQYLHPDEVTTLYILYGLAHGALGSLRRAQIFITKVCLRDLNCFTVTFLQKFVTDGRRTKNNMMGICESLLGYYIPKYPFALGVLTPMVCKTIAVERIMLSQLNYRGDLLETRLVAPDNSIIMSKRELQMFVDMFKESLKTLYSEFRKQNSATSISRVGYSLFVYGER